MYQLTLDMNIKPCPRPRMSRTGHTHMPADYRQHKNELTWEIRRQRWQPLEGPTSLEIDFNYKARRKADIGTWRTVGADIDNLVKTVMDALVGSGTIHDDDQICQLSARKRWADTNSTTIALFRPTLSRTTATPA